MQIQCLTADNVESAAPDHAAMTTSLKSFSGNWFIIKDNLNYAMVIAFDDISRWGGWAEISVQAVGCSAG